MIHVLNERQAMWQAIPPGSWLRCSFVAGLMLLLAPLGGPFRGPPLAGLSGSVRGERGQDGEREQKSSREHERFQRVSAIGFRSRSWTLLDRDRLDGVGDDVAIGAFVFDLDSRMSRVEADDPQLMEHAVDFRFLLLIHPERLRAVGMVHDDRDVAGAVGIGRWLDDRDDCWILVCNDTRAMEAY